MAAIGGEWYIEAGDGYPADPGTKRFVYATQPDGEKYIVAKVWADGGDYESTARLVAAAPDLLAALQRIVACAHMASPVGGKAYFISDDRMEAARAAISKAEGRTDDQ